MEGGERRISGSRSFCYILSWRLTPRCMRPWLKTAAAGAEHREELPSSHNDEKPPATHPFITVGIISHHHNPWGQPCPLLSKPPRTPVPLALTTLSNAQALCNIQIRTQSPSSPLSNDFIFAETVRESLSFLFSPKPEQ